MDDRTRFTFTESTDRYRETLVFNNDLLKKNYPERYEFNTKMQVEKKRRFGASDDRIARYERRRAEEYDKKFRIYSARLDNMVEPAVRRYVNNIRAVFGYE